MVRRKGLGKGTKGYKNILSNDSKIHSQSAKGIKQPQKINPFILNLDKYVGKWYEIASLPAWFQRNCKCAIAEYTKKKGYIEVKNSCLKNGEREFKYAKAYKNDENPNQLDVYFNPFIKGDYQVLYVDKNYNTAIVGTENKKYLWFLSRKPNQDLDKIKKLKKISKEFGYKNLSQMNITKKVCSK